MSRPIQARVSLSALRHNYWVAKRMAARSKVFAVVKANAYGHGIERVARALPQADGFATLEIEGAMALRERNVTAPSASAARCPRPTDSRPWSSTAR